MYTDALNTSVEAVGTLQKQQDIYMDSTAAHLQQLRTEAQKTYDILFNQKTVNGFIDTLDGALKIFNNFIDSLGGGTNAFITFGAIASKVFNEQIGTALGNMVVNMDRAKANADALAMKQQIIDTHSAQGDLISSAGVEKELTYMQKTLAVQKGLTAEQYNNLMNLQKEVGLRETEIVELQSARDILKQQGLSEKTSLDSLKLIVNNKQQELKLQKDLLTYIELGTKSAKTLTDQQKQKLEAVEYINNLESEEANILSNIDTKQYFILKKLQDANLSEKDREILLNAQLKLIENQQSKVTSLQSAVEGLTAEENGRLNQLIAEQKARERLIEEEQKEAGIRQSAQAYVQALSTITISLQTISSVVTVIFDESLTASQKFERIFSNLLITLPIIISGLNSIKTATATLAVQTGALAATTDVAKTKFLEAGAALMATPYGWIATALAAVGLAAFGASKYFDNLKESAKQAAEEASQNAETLRQESEAHQELISNFEDLKEQYDEGLISKDQLWDITNKLIDVYDLESQRLNILAGDYDTVAEAIKRERAEEIKELNERNKKAVQTATEDLIQQGRGTATDDVYGPIFGSKEMSVDLGIKSIGTGTSDFKKLKEKARELFGEEISPEGTSIIKSFSFDTENAAEVRKSIQLIQEWREIVAEALGEESSDVEKLDKIISNFTNEGTFDKLINLQDKYLESLLNSSNIDFAETEEEFANEAEKLKQLIHLEVDEGNLLLSDEEIDEAVLKYVSKINNSLAKQFIIDEEVKKKFGEEGLKLFKESLSGYDEDTQTELIKTGFDFSTLDTEEGKEKLQKYINYITGSEDGVYSIPIGVQSGLNETILKGKDINKSDWETMTASAPGAEETLGSREEFNNKSIGERIALMEELNQKIQENAKLAIEEYENLKQGAEERKADIETQIQVLEKEIAAREEKIKWMSETQELEEANKDRINEETEKVKELSNEIQELTSEKHEIDITLDASLEDDVDSLLSGMFDEVLTQTDQLKMAAESVGEAWTIAADDVANFASVFPELMNDDYITWLENGSAQLTELGRQVLNDTLSNNQQIMKSNKEVVVQAINDKITELQADAEFQEQKIAALEQYLNSSVKDTEAGNKAIAAINEAEANYEETLRSEGLINQGRAETEKVSMADQGNQGLVTGLESVNENVNALRQNYANVFNENYGSPSLPGYKGAGTSVSSGYSKGTYGAYDGGDKDTQAAVAAAKQALEDAKKQLSEDKRAIAAYEGARAKLLKDTYEANAAADRVQSGKAGKEDKSKSKGGGSKGKDKKDKDEKQWKDEFDQYWKLKKAIDATDRSIQKLEKDQEELYGYQLIDSLKKENALLETQKGNYEALLAAQNERAAALRAELGTMGVIFDASGAIVNYAEATAQALAAYNLAIQQYNAGLIDETTLGVAEKAFENFKKLLEEYDKLYYTEIQETQDKLDEIRRKELANNLKAWQTEIQVKLDKKQLKRDWNDFFKEINEDFKKLYKDLRIEQSNLLANAKTYLKNDGTINVNIQAAKEIMAEIDKMMAGGTSDKFESVSQAQEELKKFNEQIQSAAKELYDSVKQAWQNYLDGIDQVQDKLDAVQKRYEDINAQIEFQGKLIKLLYGETDTAYKLLSKYYEGMIKSTSDQIDAYKNQAEMWKAQFEKSGADINRPDSWNEDQSKLYEKWQNAQQKLNDLVIEQIELLQNDYKNTIDSIVRDLEKEITGSRLSTIQDEWEQIQKTSEGYYDNIESLYQIQTLANKFDESIASTTSLKNQQKLQKLREKEINELKAILEERKEVSEYEVKAAEAKYQIALQEIALEEAQNNKTSMKLTRNEQGNWSYQYVSDEDDVLSKRQALLDSYNDLYQLASNAYQENLEKIQELTEEFLTKQKEIKENEELTEEEKQIALDKLRSYYYERYNKLAIENDTLRNDLASATAATLKELYDQDEANLSSMTEEEQQLVKTLADEHISDFSDVEDAVKDNYKQIGDKAKQVCSETKKEWNSGAQEMINRWAADNGTSVKASVEKAYDKMKVASDKYKAAVEKLADQVEMDFGESGITGAINKAEEATNDLKDATEDLAEEGSTYIDSLRKTVEDLEEAWNKVKDAIQEAINLIEEYLNKVAEANAASASTGNAGGGDADSASASNSQSSSSSSSTPSSSSTSTEEEKKKKRRGGTSFNNRTYGTGGTDVSVMASGGYTGEWGEEGRLAFLHQKELVLNKKDTENFLSGISMIRDMTSLNGSIESSILKSIANMALQITGINPGLFQNNNSNNTQSNNTFNITAEFPNANNVDDIRQAILTLPNIASQFINSNSR